MRRWMRASLPSDPLPPTRWRNTTTTNSRAACSSKRGINRSAHTKHILAKVSHSPHGKPQPQYKNREAKRVYRLHLESRCMMFVNIPCQRYINPLHFIKY
ncbi:hypothetical protein PAXRUDRAFT_790383 [Paxillus rubicundulus Ve08.2h10]|uniref:Uncharacterized protein n=1 Tax=Paxillus rubicundulus Ve08.2h10 TaxID=930991 RepID=A0A0D0DW31_9AGAM|nr:hypothetical protein PAXRUDRAFT_790383 [Paxillus rubicundulus Ve08.2h10]